jgi:hypothetical protein
MIIRVESRDFMFRRGFFVTASVSLNQTRIRNVERYLGAPDGKDFYVTVPLNAISLKQLKAAGFSDSPSEGIEFYRRYPDPLQN